MHTFYGGIDYGMRV